MALKQSLKISQGMTMTPQLQQAIKILQMSTFELQQEVNNILAENPTLEEVDDPIENNEGPSEKLISEVEPKDPVELLKEDFDWENYLQNFSNISTQGVYTSKDELPQYDQFIASKTTLYDHLLWQLGVSVRDSKLIKIGEEIIGNINEAGYLSCMVEEVSSTLDVSVEKVQEALNLIQKFDPVGVGAKSLKECLCIQARLLPDKDDLLFIIENHLADLENKNYTVVSKALELPIESTIKLCQIIHGFEPKPGRPFLNEHVLYAVPDVFVIKKKNEFKIVLNEEFIPRVRVSKFYQLQAQKKKIKLETKKYLKGKMKEAAWFLKSIEQRQSTVYRVAEQLLEKQKDFFENGIPSLKPLILKEVADALGLHESTISRVTTNKFIHTPHGIFELKFFFSNKISKGNTSVAAQSVKQLISDYISNESPKRPLSDQQIVDLLKEEGIKIARRTIAKYRESLGILPSGKRKKYF